MKKAIVLIIIVLSTVLMFSCEDDNEITSVVIGFDANNDLDILKITYDKQSGLSLPSDPIKNGYIFDGWFFDNHTFLEPFDDVTIETFSPKSDLIFYAKWIEEPFVFDPLDVPYYAMQFYYSESMFTFLGYSLISTYGGYLFKNKDDMYDIFNPIISQENNLKIDAFRQYLTQYDDAFFIAYDLVFIAFVVSSTEKDIHQSLPIYIDDDVLHVPISVYYPNLGHTQDLKAIPFAMAVEKKYMSNVDSVKIVIDNTADRLYPYTAYYWQ